VRPLTLRWLALLVLCAAPVVGTPSAAARAEAPPPPAQPAACFAETGKCAQGLAYAYWRENGGLERQGLPITDEFDEAGADGRTHRVQYFERARLELHQENVNTPFVVELGLLGREQFDARYPQGRPPAATGDACFTETSRCVSGRFLAYWQRNGGLAQFGYPLSDEFDERGQVDDRTYRVQYFERARFELHPENPAPYLVELALLGTAALGQRPERDAPAVACDAGCDLSAPTGHSLRGAFRRYWQGGGGLPVFGYPLTEELQEVSLADGKAYTVQYFERARFELHPEYAGTPYEVLLGPMGLETLNTGGWYR